ncbi:MAG: hypothetical protein BZY88_17680 [SAR202 cluster bacterium Io17-Chloro-G9]|nr:MAG: hypothetical protein BZY88_17680 [SAR202 cluster bacterium Io17-Chloro-G9]
MATAIDPICKMEVDTENPPGGQSEHQGTTYYFCAPGCKVAFEQDPGKYLSAEVEHGHDHDHGHDHGHGDFGPEKKPGFFARLFGRG